MRYIATCYDGNQYLALCVEVDEDMPLRLHWRFIKERVETHFGMEDCLTSLVAVSDGFEPAVLVDGQEVAVASL